MAHGAIYILELPQYKGKWNSVHDFFVIRNSTFLEGEWKKLNHGEKSQQNI